MLAKKRAREEEGLHADETVLQYQNRCLISRVRDLKEDLVASKLKIDALTNQSMYLSKVFMEVNCRLLNMSESLGIIMCHLSIESAPVDAPDKIGDLGIRLLKTVMGDFGDKEQLAEEHSSMLENMRVNIENIAGKLMSGLSLVNNPKVNFDLEQKLTSMYCDLASKTNELNKMKAEHVQWSNIVKMKDDEIEKLKVLNASLNRSIVASPLIPYIKYSQEFFKAERTEHTCSCGVCGRDIPEEVINNEMLNESKPQPGSALPMNVYSMINGVNGDAQQNNMVVYPNNPNSFSSGFQPNVIILQNQTSSNMMYQDKTEELRLKEENEVLTEKIKELIQENEDMKHQFTLNEAKLIESQVFSSLVDQAESNITCYDQLKEYYMRLNSKYVDLVKEIDFEKKKSDDRESKYYEDFKKKYYDLREENSRAEKKIKSLQLKIEDMENYKSSMTDFSSTFEFFDKEKKRLTNELSELKNLLLDTREKYNQEVNKNLKHTEELVRITGELEFFKEKSNETVNNNNESINKNYKEEDCWKQLRQMKEKNSVLEKKMNKYKEDYNAEREANDLLIREAEANEQGLNEMNSTLSLLQKNYEDEKGKVSKLIQEKINDHKKIELLNSEREKNKKLLQEKNSLNDTHKEYEKKLGEENRVLQESLKLCEEELKTKEVEIFDLSSQICQLNKKINELESVINQEAKALNSYRQENGTLKAAYETVKSIGEGKRKNKDDKSLNTEEYKAVLEENAKLKVSMLIINVDIVIH